MAEARLNRDLKPLAKDVERLNLLMIAVIIVLFVGFSAMFGTMATLVINHFDNTQSSYNNLRNQVQQQNAKIDELTQTLHK